MIPIICFKFWNKRAEAMRVLEDPRNQTFVAIRCNFSEVVNLGSQPPPICLAKHSINFIDLRAKQISRKGLQGISYAR